jgi:hypothetical protein
VAEPVRKSPAKRAGGRVFATPPGRRVGRNPSPGTPRKVGPGLDVGKFVGEVGANAGRGIGELQKAAARVIPGGARGGAIQRAMTNAPAARKALAPALGKKSKP